MLGMNLRVSFKDDIPEIDKSEWGDVPYLEQMHSCVRPWVEQLYRQPHHKKGFGR